MHAAHPPRSRRLPAATVLALLVACSFPLSPAAAEAGEWPQWRGPDGAGVSSTVDGLPATWDAAGDNVRWHSEIPGEGISSPIVSGDRIFVTTAYEGASGGFSQTALRVVVFGAVALLLLSTVLSLRGADRRERGPGGLVHGLDRLIFGLSTLGFLVMAVIVALGPDALEYILAKMRLLVGRVGLARLDNTLYWVPGNIGPLWLVSGSIALIGLAVAFGWIRAGSRARLFGAIVVFAAAVFYVMQAPPDQYTNAFPLWKRLSLAAPGLLLALWSVLAHLASRGRDRTATTGHGGRALLFEAALLAIAAMIFIPANYLQPSIGLQRAVIAIDATSGELLWDTPVGAAPAEAKHALNSYATPTPCTDGEHVFAYFGAWLASLDFDGNVQWSIEFPDYASNSRYGASASPVVLDDMIILVQERELLDGTNPSWLAAFDKRTGERRWEVQPENAHSSYATPLLWRREGRTELITATSLQLVAYDAASGERLWTHEYAIEQMVPSLVAAGDLLILSGGTHGEKATMVLRVEGEGAAAQTTVLWENARNVPDVSSPVLYQGMLFIVDKNGIMTNYDAQTGDVHWKQRLGGGLYYASLLGADGKVFASTYDGVTNVVAAAPDFELLGENDLGASIASSPAVGNGCLLLRAGRQLYCLD